MIFILSLLITVSVFLWIWKLCELIDETNKFAKLVSVNSGKEKS